MNKSILVLAALVFLSVNSQASDAHKAEASVSADQAQKWLINGNRRFTSGHFRNDGKRAIDIHKLEAGQHPHSIVLSCSDSRVPPEHVFDQALGEIFVIRVAGEALDTSVIASIEYAVEHLGSKNIVVMGHTHCGAVKAALGATKGKSIGSDSLDALVNDIKPRLPASAKSEDLHEESSMNAEGVAKDLLKRSPIIKAKVDSGDVKIRSGIYYLKDGHVGWL